MADNVGVLGTDRMNDRKRVKKTISITNHIIIIIIIIIIIVIRMSVNIMPRQRARLRSSGPALPWPRSRA